MFSQEREGRERCEVDMCTGILKPGTEMRRGAFIHVDTHTCTLVFINGIGIVHFICTGILKPGTQTRHTNWAYTHCISENYVPVQPNTIIGQSVHFM